MIVIDLIRRNSANVVPPMRASNDFESEPIHGAFIRPQSLLPDEDRTRVSHTRQPPTLLKAVGSWIRG
jgi:hypothetical protein